MSIIKQYNTLTSQWDAVQIGVQGPSGTIAVTGPITNTGTSTSAILSIQNSPSFTGTSTFTGTASSSPSVIAAAGRLRVVGSPVDTAAVVELVSTDGVYNYIYKQNAGGLNFTTSVGLAQTIDSGGRVLIPNQPACLIDGNNSNWFTIASGNYITGTYWGLSWQRGGFTFNATTGAVTVPVTGYYRITYRNYQAGSTGKRHYFRKNGVDFGFQQAYVSSDSQTTDVQVVYANANDYFQVYVQTAANAYYGSQHTQLFVDFLG